MQQMADEKILDARLLLQNNRFSNAYYLAGYAVELALKACVSRQFQTDVIPEKSLATAIWVHDLPKLVSLAGLQPALATRSAMDLPFRTNWGIVSQWGPDARYGQTTPQNATDLLDAVDDAQAGVLPWIKLYW